MAIDIIMPCYYTNAIIRPALEKIANQTAINEITLIMVNDCSPNTTCDYQDLIKEYKDRINIRYFKTPTNVGPGESRQLGLENATNEWVTFHDDDDELYDEHSIENYLNAIKEHPNIFSVTGGVLYQNFFTHTEDIHYHVFNLPNNTAFNRKLLQKLNIHFEPLLSFREEDGCFSNMCDIYGHQYERMSIEVITYKHKAQDNHISVTSRFCEPAMCMLQLLGNKAYSISYVANVLKTIDNLQWPFDNIVNEGIGYIPNLFVNIYSYLKDNHIKLTPQEFEKLNIFINLYNSFLTQFNISDYSIFDSDRIKFLCSFFLQVQDEHYANYDWDTIVNFPNIYQDILTDIKVNYTEQE